MTRIIRDLVTGKMNLRKLILWVLAVAAAIPIIGSLWTVFRALLAVAAYTIQHPEVWLK